ncbi:hypothetical protein OKJ48_23605 [Streptomyces kunmingensis]|uniref:Secreted protein n=1 Tax=Streptomyces kunmingensis TaxID=68225 RepID=A0ABU6CET5_9ACTN|nr:hypothetical protein [Streptomyces kunmingensis]MEB3963206.1 hypothetical protein [Streptomyces kunmingensis]
MTVRTVKFRNSALAFMVVCGLSGGLTLATGTDAAAKRPQGKYNRSFADFAAGYSNPPAEIRCSYLESWQGFDVEEYLCNGPVGGPAVMLLDQILAGNNVTPNPNYDNKKWEYLAAPDKFKCSTSAAPDKRTTETYTCTYKHQHDDGHWYTHNDRDLSKSVLSTTDAGTDLWYLQHKTIPTS